MLDFPSAPANGQQYTYLSKTWAYDSVKPAWTLVPVSSTDASAAASSAVAAAASAAAVAYIYGGTFTVAPVLRPDGTARVAGDQYFNSVASLTYRWNGASWVASDINTANLAASTGAGLVGAADGAAGSLWTTVAGFVARIISSAGASVIGFIQAGVGSVLRTVQSKLREVSLSVFDFGGVGDGVADEYAAILKTQNAVVAAGGGTVYFPPGYTYRIGTAIPFAAGVTYRGGGRSGIDNVAVPGSKIISSVSSIFANGAATLTGVTFDGLWLESSVGGGHIFDFSNAGIVAKVEVKNSILVQNNPAKAVVQGTAAGGVFSIWMHDFEYKYASGNTVPALNFASSTINGIVIDKFWSTGANVSAGTYSIWIESTSPGGAAFGNRVSQGTFEVPGGGSVNLLSCYHTTLDQCVVYDLSVVPANPAFRIAKGATGPASTNCKVTGCRSKFGTALKPDLQIDMSVAGAGQFTVSESSFLWADGVSASSNGISTRGPLADNIENVSYTTLGESLTADVQWISTGVGTRNYSVWNGVPSNFAGYLITYQNGAHVGSISPTGLWQWGGTPISPNVYIQAVGNIFTKGKVYPGTDAGVDQGACGLLAGNGIPTNANGLNGDIYFRGDGGAGTAIYQRRAGVWVAVA